jgi:hypothetical protein
MEFRGYVIEPRRRCCLQRGSVVSFRWADEQGEQGE